MSEIIFVILLFPLLVLLEFIYGLVIKRNTYQNIKDTFSSLSLSLAWLGVTALVSGLMLSFNYFLYQFRLFDIGQTWYEIVLLFVVIDFSFYWWHRSSHRVRVLWANHINHHSSREFNFSTALRFPLFAPIIRPLFFLHIPIIGFEPTLMYGIGIASLVWTVFCHTKHIGSLGPLEYILVTPSHHRVHHGSNEEYIDKNYGATLIIWDKLFGTFQPELGPVKFGLVKNINTYNPIKTIFHEWSSWVGDLRRSRSLKDLFKFTFRPPGYKN